VTQGIAGIAGIALCRCDSRHCRLGLGGWGDSRHCRLGLGGWGLGIGGWGLGADPLKDPRKLDVILLKRWSFDPVLCGWVGDTVGSALSGCVGLGACWSDDGLAAPDVGAGGVLMLRVL
jgi:hypothetical protein